MVYTYTLYMYTSTRIPRAELFQHILTPNTPDLDPTSHTQGQ